MINSALSVCYVETSRKFSIPFTFIQGFPAELHLQLILALCAPQSLSTLFYECVKRWEWGRKKGKRDISAILIYLCTSKVNKFPIASSRRAVPGIILGWYESWSVLSVTSLHWYFVVLVRRTFVDIRLLEEVVNVILYHLINISRTEAHRSSEWH